MAQALTLADPFVWFPVIDPGDPAASQSPHTAGLVMAADGVHVIGGEVNGNGEHEAFSLSGQVWDGYSAQATTRFDRWSAQLALRDQPLRSLGTLFTVDRRVKGD